MKLHSAEIMMTAQLWVETQLNYKEQLMMLVGVQLALHAVLDSP